MYSFNQTLICILLVSFKIRHDYGELIIRAKSNDVIDLRMIVPKQLLSDIFMIITHKLAT